MTLALIEMAREVGDPRADTSTTVIEEQSKIREGG